MGGCAGPVALTIMLDVVELLTMIELAKLVVVGLVVATEDGGELMLGLDVERVLEGLVVGLVVVVLGLEVVVVEEAVVGGLELVTPLDVAVAGREVDALLNVLEAGFDVVMLDAVKVLVDKLQGNM